MRKFQMPRAFALALLLILVLCLEQTAHAQTILWTILFDGSGALAVAPTSGQLVYTPVPVGVEVGTPISQFFLIDPLTGQFEQVATNDSVDVRMAIWTDGQLGKDVMIGGYGGFNAVLLDGTDLWNIPDAGCCNDPHTPPVIDFSRSAAAISHQLWGFKELDLATGNRVGPILPGTLDGYTSVAWNNNIYVASADVDPALPPQAYLISFNPDAENQNFEVYINDVGNESAGAMQEAAVAADGSAIVTRGSDHFSEGPTILPGELARVMLDGTLLWNIAADAVTPPIIGGNGLIYVGTQDPMLLDGAIEAHDPDTGALVWTQPVNGTPNDLIVADNSQVYAVAGDPNSETGGELDGFDELTGQPTFNVMNVPGTYELILQNGIIYTSGPSVTAIQVPANNYDPQSPWPVRFHDNQRTGNAQLAPPNTQPGPGSQVMVMTQSTAIPSATLTFSNVSSPGATTVVPSGTGPASPANFSLGSQPTYMEVSSNAAFSGDVNVCFNYVPSLFGDPTMLHLLHFENNTWLDVTTSNDTTNGTICGGVGSFSPFTVAQGPSSAGQSLTKAAATTSLGLGTVPVGDTVIKNLIVRNTGHATLFVNGISSSNPAEFAATASPCPAGVAPLQSCTIPINFLPLGVGARTATLTVIDNTGAGSQVVALSGNGTIDATVRPSAYSIYYTKFGTKVVKAVSVLNRQNNSVSLSKSVTGPNAADFQITGGTCGSTLAPHAVCSIDVTYTPGILGAESAQLNVTDKPDPLGPYVVPFNVAGTIPETVAPLNLSYGTISQASSRTLKAIVTNKSPFAISVSSSTSGLNAADFTISGGTCTGTLAANSSCTVAVTFKPTSAASESAMLAVSVPQDPTSPHNVNLIGTGI
jgi:Abnormal spindle-like microcephaly-assoc'd, ASPM-SPD-2-Hydin